MIESEAPDIYRGMNPAFVRKVWAKRRGAANKPHPNHPGRPISWSQSNIDEIAKCLEAGLSSGQISRKLGISIGSVSGLVRRVPELKAIGFQTAYAKKLREKTS